MSTQSFIRVMCPNLGCQRILAVPVSARGKVVRCGACGLNVRIPMPRQQSSDGAPGDKENDKETDKDARGSAA